MSLCSQVGLMETYEVDIIGMFFFLRWGHVNFAMTVILRTIWWFNHHTNTGSFKWVNWYQLSTWSSWWLNQPIWKICSSDWIISPGIRVKRQSNSSKAAVILLWSRNPCPWWRFGAIKNGNMFPSTKKKHAQQNIKNSNVTQIIWLCGKKNTAPWNSQTSARHLWANFVQVLGVVSQKYLGHQASNWFFEKQQLTEYH